MSIYSWLFGSKRAEERTLTLESGINSGLVPDFPTRTGVTVTEATALGVSSVYAAIKVISETVGSLPCVLYRKTDEGREQADDLDLFDLLDRDPNPETTRNVFFETLMANALLWGNGFAEVERDNTGNPVNLWIIHPQYVQILRDTNTGELVYRVQVPYTQMGQPNQSGHVVYIKQPDMIHLRGLSTDSATGLNILRVARDNISFSIAADRWGQAFFGNAARLGGQLKVPPEMSDLARNNLGRSFAAAYQGVDKVGKIAVTDNTITFEPLTVRNDQAELNDTRMFQIGEVCRLFNLSPMMLQQFDRATWGNYSLCLTAFYTITCRPWLEKLESEMERKLLKGSDRRALYIEFDADAITRGDRMTRMQIYDLGIKNRVYTPDECREWENLPALPDDVLNPETPPKEATPQVIPDNTGLDEQTEKDIPNSAEVGY